LAKREGIRLKVYNNVLAKARFIFPGFRVAASGLARNDGFPSFVIPAQAGIQDFMMHPSH